MKTFTEYLTESKKTYEFKVGFAGELPEGIEDTMETALKKYGVANQSSGKRTPISEKPLDFPQLQNVEVTYYDVELNYPTTPQVLEEYLAQMCGVDRTHVIVRTPLDPRNEYQEKTSDEPYEALLNTQDMGGESAQESVGGNRVMELLKELEKARAERETDPSTAGPTGESKDITDDANNKSPVGS